MTRMSSSTRPAQGVAIREAVAGDAEDIGRVRHASWQVAYSGLVPADYLAGLSVDGFVLSARRMLADRAARRMVVLVAEVGGVVSGFASVGPSRDDDEAEGSVGELYAIYLDPAIWRLGIGSRLQEVALERLRGGGVRRGDVVGAGDQRRVAGLLRADRVAARRRGLRVRGRGRGAGRDPVPQGFVILVVGP